AFVLVYFDQFASLVVNTDHCIMCAAGLYTGQRLGDLRKLTWRAVDLEANEISFTTRKTGRRIVLPLMPPLRGIRRRWAVEGRPNPVVHFSLEKSEPNTILPSVHDQTFCCALFRATPIQRSDRLCADGCNPVRWQAAGNVLGGTDNPFNRAKGFLY